MNIGLLFPRGVWGGAVLVFQQIQRGLLALGHQATFIDSPFANPTLDFVFIGGYGTFDLRRIVEDLSHAEVPFGIIPFYENQIQFHGPATGMYEYISMCLRNSASIEALYETPHLCFYYGDFMKRFGVYNFRSLQKAKLWVANSKTEAKDIQRDHPEATIATIPIPPGIITQFQGEPDDSFLRFSGLTSGNYILQIGRLENRKNQLGTILATRDLDIPLVFISTMAVPHYELDCFEAASRWRKAPTLFISQKTKERSNGAMRVMTIPEEKPLSPSMIASAFHHAGLHLHPAFNEIPGLTYLEAARFGTPSIASAWCTINDYFYDPTLGHSELDGRIAYCEPWDLPTIKTLAETLFGKKFPPLLQHPAIQRTEIDFAKELVGHLAKQGFS